MEDNKSAYVVAYSIMTFSGFIMGFLVGWIVWGIDIYSTKKNLNILYSFRKHAEERL